MRHILFTLSIFSFLPACLPDPADLLFGDRPDSQTSAEEVSVGDYEDGSDSNYEDGGYSNKEHYASSSFTYDSELKLAEGTNSGTSQEPVAEDMDNDEDEIEIFGTSDLMLICSSNAPAVNPVGYIRVSIEATIVSEKLPVESWQSRLEVPCAGTIKFEYYKITQGHNYSVKIEQLKTDGSIAKTMSGSFAVPAEITDNISFELK